jgi:hypothetical protein
LAGCAESAAQPPSIAATEAAVINHFEVPAPEEARFDFFVVMFEPFCGEL